MIFIAFGANLPGQAGQPQDTYEAALAAMEKAGIHITARSSLWQTAPVDVPDEQPDYTNAVVAVETELPPQALLETLLAIEQEFGRVRTFKNAAKSIDLDLIAYEGQVLGDPDRPEKLIVPHPRMHGRAFVLLPLKEIAPNWTHPVSEKTLNDLIRALPADQRAEKLEDRDAA